MKTARNTHALLPATVIIAGIASGLIPGTASAQRAAGFGPEVRQYIAYDAPTLALTHVRIIDGTGGPVLEDRTILIDDGRIAAVGPAGTVTLPAGTVVLDRPGDTVMPGLVGMHDHLFDVPPRTGYPDWTWMPATYTAPRLYLAHGVTTIRTTGSVALNIDLGTRRAIDAGLVPGPRINVTSPYLTDAQTASISCRESSPTCVPMRLRHAARRGRQGRRRDLPGLPVGPRGRMERCPAG